MNRFTSLAAISVTVTLILFSRRSADQNAGLVISRVEPIRSLPRFYSKINRINGFGWKSHYPSEALSSFFVDRVQLSIAFATKHGICWLNRGNRGCKYVVQSNRPDLRQICDQVSNRSVSANNSATGTNPSSMISSSLAQTS